MGVDPRQHLRRLERFGYVIDAARRETGDLAVGVRQRRHEDYRDVAGRSTGLQPPAGGETIQTRHHHIQQDQIGADEFSPPHPFLPVLRHQHAEALGLQAIDHHRQIGGRVVDDQNRR